MQFKINGGTLELTIPRKLDAILLFLLILTLPFGAYLFPFSVGGFTIYAFRIVLFVSFIYLVISRRIRIGIGHFSLSLSLILIVWFAYAAVSLIWVVDFDAAVRELFHIFVGAIFHVSLVSFYNATKKGKSIFATAWIISFAALSLLALFEITTRFHLPSYATSIMERLSTGHRLRSMPLATFHNPNNFSVYLLISLPFFLSYYVRKTSSNAAAIAIALIIYFVTKSESRLGILCLLIQLLSFGLWISVFSSPIHRLVPSGRLGNVLLVPILLVVVFGNVLISERPFDPVQTTSIVRERPVDLPAVPSFLPQDRSTAKRYAMIRNGLHFFVMSNGLGIGAGNFGAYMERDHGIYGTPLGAFGTRQRDPHSFYIEMLSQYGVPIFALFTLWFTALFVFIVSLFTKKFIRTTRDPRPFYLIALFAGYIIMANAQSRFVPNPLNYLALSVLSIYADAIRMRFRSFIRRTRESR